MCLREHISEGVYLHIREGIYVRVHIMCVHAHAFVCLHTTVLLSYSSCLFPSSQLSALPHGERDEALTGLGLHESLSFSSTPTSLH